jgi:hypothetical protein
MLDISPYSELELSPMNQDAINNQPDLNKKISDKSVNIISGNQIISPHNKI